MTLKHMTIFAAICQTGSFTKAADQLNMTQPQVSLAIHELESFYQVRLFDRLNRTIYLTEDGKTLLHYAVDIIDQFTEASNVLRNTNRITSLRIGCNVSFSSTGLMPFLQSFQNTYPDCKLKLYVNNTNQIEQQLLKNEIDLAITDNISHSANIYSKLIAQEELCPAFSPGYKKITSPHLTLSELVKYPLLLREPGSGIRETVDHVFHSYQLSVTPMMESISTTALIEAAIHNLGIVILPKERMKNELLSGTLCLIDLKDARFGRNYYLTYHKHKHQTPAMNAFFDLIPDFNVCG